MPRFYLRNKVVDIEEDMTHEFKGHRHLSVDELSSVRFAKNRLDDGRWTLEKHTSHRSPVSRAFCGMLNTGRGGTVYLGITDEGRARGLMLSLYQRDHIRLAVQTILSKYRPQVPPHMYSVRFVPVVESEEDLKSVTKVSPLPAVNRRLPHEILSQRYCWCDNLTWSALQSGTMERFYVVEVQLAVWDPTHPGNSGLVMPAVPEIGPVFQNEEGECFLRRNGCTEQLRIGDILDMVKSRARTILANRGRVIGPEIPLLAVAAEESGFADTGGSSDFSSSDDSDGAYYSFGEQ